MSVPTLSAAPPNAETESTRKPRKSVWVNSFQTKLFYRMTFYWLVYTITLLNLLFAWRLAREGSGDIWQQWVATVYENAPLFLCFLIVTPWIGFDAVRFANRLVGPLARFRKALQTVAANEPVRPLRLRKDDFLLDMQDDLNAMLAALEQRRAVRLERDEAASKARR